MPTCWQGPANSWRPGCAKVARSSMSAMGSKPGQRRSGNASFSIGTCSVPGVQESTFSRDHLRDSLELRLSDLTSPLSPMVKELIPADPSGEFMKILQTWMTWTAPARHQGVWFSSDLRRALLVAETHAAGFDMESQEQLQGHIREAFRRDRRNSHWCSSRSIGDDGTQRHCR